MTIDIEKYQHMLKESALADKPTIHYKDLEHMPLKVLVKIFFILFKRRLISRLRGERQ